MLNLPFLHWFLEGPLQVLEVRSFRGRPVDAQGRCVAGGLPLQYLNQKSFVGKWNHSDFLPEIFIFLSAFQYKILHLGVDFYHKNVIFRPSVPCLFSKYFTERNIKFDKLLLTRFKVSSFTVVSKLGLHCVKSSLIHSDLFGKFWKQYQYTFWCLLFGHCFDIGDDDARVRL